MRKLNTEKIFLSTEVLSLEILKEIFFQINDIILIIDSDTDNVK